DGGADDREGRRGLEGGGEATAEDGDGPWQRVFHAQFRQPVAGMQDQGDHGGAHAVEYSVHRLQIAEMDVEGAERRDDREIREDKSPTSGPCAPESGTQG